MPRVSFANRKRIWENFSNNGASEQSHWNARVIKKELNDLSFARRPPPPGTSAGAHASHQHELRCVCLNLCLALARTQFHWIAEEDSAARDGARHAPPARSLADAPFAALRRSAPPRAAAQPRPHPRPRDPRGFGSDPTGCELCYSHSLLFRLGRKVVHKHAFDFILRV